MKAYRILFTLLLPLLPLLGAAQPVYFKTYISLDSSSFPSVSNFNAVDIVPIGNGRHAILGDITASDTTNWTHQSLYIMQVGQDGQPIRFDEYEDQAPFIIGGPRAYALCADGQGNFYAAIGSNNRQIIVKADETGNLHWAISQNHHEYYDLLCNNSGVTILGQDESIQGLHDFSIAHLDQNGGDGMGIMYGTADFELPERIISLPDGGFLLVGSSTVSSNARIIVLRLDATMQLVWGKVYTDNVHRLFAREVAAAPDGFYICGHVDATTAGALDSLFLLKIDTAGNHLTTHIYGTDSWTLAQAEDLILAPDGYLYFCASIRDTAYFYPVILKINPNGSPEIAKSYDDANPDSEEFYNALAWDGHLVATGDRVRLLPGFQVAREIVFSRFDDTLSNGCVSSVPVGANSLSLNVSGGIMSQPYQITDTMTFGPHTHLANTSLECSVPVGVDVAQPQSPWLFFQNPAPLDWRIRYDLPAEDGHLTLRDMQGRVLHETHLSLKRGQVAWEISDLSSGLYLLQAHGEGWASPVHKVMVQR